MNEHQIRLKVAQEQSQVDIVEIITEYFKDIDRVLTIHLPVNIEVHHFEALCDRMNKPCFFYVGNSCIIAPTYHQLYAAIKSI